MELKINSAKVGARGKNNYGDWALVVLGTDKGEWTTLHKEAETIKPGMVIGIDKISIEEKDGKEKKNFKEFVIISGGTAPGPDKPTPANGKPTMTPADWERKDKLELWSKERNACYMGLPELIACQPAEGKAKEAWEAAIDYAIAHFNTLPAPVPSKAKKAATEPSGTAKTKSDKEFDNLGETPTFKNAGEFLTKVTKELGISRGEVLVRLSINDVKEIASLEEAWATLTGKTIEPEDLPFET